MPDNQLDRRMMLLGLTSAGTILADPKKQEQEKEVTANEDLMREHGVIRRALLVYTAVADKIRAGAPIDAGALNRTAKLFRSFGEDYHEKRLEEAFIFPAVRKRGGEAARFADILEKQHQRGREITDWVTSVTASGSVASKNTSDLAKVLDGMTLMYRHHAAREDTIIFPAWKQGLTSRGYEEMGDKFEAIEHQVFGHDGFEDAEKQISAIEEAFGLADIAQFTPPPPPSTETA